MVEVFIIEDVYVAKENRTTHCCVGIDELHGTDDQNI